MNDVLKLKNDEWFNIKDYFKNNMKHYVITGARGCGKTHSLLQFCKGLFLKGMTVLYIRNSRSELATARQYFQSFCTDNEKIELGSLGANTIVLRREDERVLIGYTLFIGDYEVLKSSKRHIDYIIYEEFSTFKQGIRFNRVFSLIEIMESVKQMSDDYYFFAISNNIYKDSLFDVILESDDFLHLQIFKDAVKINVKNELIRNYLQGDYLVPSISINLSNHECLGFFLVGGQKIYLYEGVNCYPQYVISSTGNGKQIKVDMESVKMLELASYKNLDERNVCEFACGLLTFSSSKLRG